MKKAILISTLAITLASCAVSAKNDGVMKAQERSGGFMGLSTNADVEVNTAAAFKDKNQVVIGGFKVGFNESKVLKNQAKGLFGGGGFGGRATGLVKLENINDSTRQKITDNVYKDFVAELKSKGYTVLPFSKFTSSKAYIDNGTKEYDFPYENDDSGFLSSYGVAKYFSPKVIGSKQPIFMGEIDGVTGGFGFANVGNAAAEYAKENNIPVLNVTYFVDFAGGGGHESMFSASMEVGQLLAVDQGKLGLTGGYGGTFSSEIGSLTLGQPIASDEEFATIEENTDALSVGVETAANVLSTFMGGGTNQQREFSFKANPSKYSSAATEALKKANDAFVGKMAELK